MGVVGGVDIYGLAVNVSEANPPVQALLTFLTM